jgi:hypothetical protein
VHRERQEARLDDNAEDHVYGTLAVTERKSVYLATRFRR